MACGGSGWAVPCMTCGLELAVEGEGESDETTCRSSRIDHHGGRTADQREPCDRCRGVRWRWPPRWTPWPSPRWRSRSADRCGSVHHADRPGRRHPDHHRRRSVGRVHVRRDPRRDRDHQRRQARHRRRLRCARTIHGSVPAARRFDRCPTCRCAGCVGLQADARPPNRRRRRRRGRAAGDRRIPAFLLGLHGRPGRRIRTSDVLPG